MKKLLFYYLAKILKKEPWEVKFIWAGYSVVNPGKSTFPLFIEFLIMIFNHPARMHEKYLRVVRQIEDGMISMASLICGFGGLARNMEAAKVEFEKLSSQISNPTDHE